MSMYPRLSILTYIGFELNSLLENSCNYDTIDFSYVYTGIADKDLIQKLESDFPDSVDFSIFKSENKELETLYSSLSSVAGGLQGQERRKLGIEKSGLNLLLAFILEIIQRQSHT